MWEGALKCLLWFFLWSEVTKGLTFVLTAGVSMMVAKGESAKLFLIEGLEEGIHSFVD